MTGLIQNRRSLDVVRTVQVSCRYARFQNLLIRQARNRLDPAGQIIPELVKVPRSGETAGHPYDGDVELVTHLTVAQSLQGGSQRSFTRYGVNSR